MSLSHGWQMRDVVDGTRAGVPCGLPESRRTLRRRVGASVDDALVDGVHDLRDARRLAREELEAPHALVPGAPRLALGRLDDGRRVGVHLRARHVVPCQEAGAGLVGAEVEQLVRAGGRAPLVSAERREVESLRAHLLVPREGAGLRAVSKRWLSSRGTDAGEGGKRLAQM